MRERDGVPSAVRRRLMARKTESGAESAVSLFPAAAARGPPLPLPPRPLHFLSLFLPRN